MDFKPIGPIIADVGDGKFYFGVLPFVFVLSFDLQIVTLFILLESHDKNEYDLKNSHLINGPTPIPSARNYDGMHCPNFWTIVIYVL